MDKQGDITAPGTEIIDFTRIFRAAEKASNQYIVEQDNAGQTR